MLKSRISLKSVATGFNSGIYGPCLQRSWLSASAAAAHDPLRILFCGADEFSIYSLRALNELKANDSIISSIDVVCRKDKQTGRGLKVVRAVPIKKVATEELDLPLHQIDTFTGWEPPRRQGASINLIIAVSFGLLVPPRILKGAKYGGLNVHPSMLPDLRGPAPIHWTLLQGRTHTGVTLQTLHPEHFDQGVIIDQTPHPGIPLGPAVSETYKSVLQLVGNLGADMLCRNIQDGSFVPPYRHLPYNTDDGGATGPYTHAPKITPADRHIDWSSWTADCLLTRDRIIGPLWDDVTSTLLRSSSSKSSAQTRVAYYGWQDVTAEIFSRIQHGQSDSPNEAAFMAKVAYEWRLCFRTCDGRILSPNEVVIGGRKKVQTSDLVQSLVSESAR